MRTLQRAGDWVGMGWVGFGCLVEVGLVGLSRSVVFYLVWFWCGYRWLSRARHSSALFQRTN